MIQKTKISTYKQETREKLKKMDRQMAKKTKKFDNLGILSMITPTVKLGTLVKSQIVIFHEMFKYFLIIAIPIIVIFIIPILIVKFILN